MIDLNLGNLPIVRAAEAAHTKAASSLELTDAHLQRIGALNPELNAYISITAERARADARRATDELMAGESRGPMHGIPIAHKDLYETAGTRTTGGSKIHAQHVPVNDRTVTCERGCRVTRLRTTVAPSWAQAMSCTKENSMGT